LINYLFRFAKENVLRFLVGNKCDLEHRRAVSTEQGKELARQYNIQFIETSAKDTINIDELFINTTKIFLDKQTSGNVVKKDNKVLKGSKNINVGDKTPNDNKKSDCCN